MKARFDELFGPMREPDRELLRNQFYCINGNSGYEWMVQYMPSYDELPRATRKYLQHSPFNICTLCLEGERVDAVKVREHQIRTGIHPVQRKV